MFISTVEKGESLFRTDLDECAHDIFVDDVGEYPELNYSMREVARAGEALKQDLYWSENSKPETLRVFSIVNSFRDAHLFPMRSIRLSVLSRMRNLGITGLTAARPKRLVSIRKKLIRHSGKLNQIQDLAGCRAILDDIAGVRALVLDCTDRVPHELLREYNYIDAPKDDGYRSHHLVFRFVGKGTREVFSGRRVEIQIRTRLQHSWATAVEAVGLFRNEDLKAGVGDSDWLRLFYLMSIEFADTEECLPKNLVSTHNARVREIRKLNENLDATNVLENLRQVFRYVREYVRPAEKSRYYLIRFDRTAGQVTVEPFFNSGFGSQSLHDVEMQIDSEQGAEKVALVEVDKIEKLVAAYPNYFGDVHLFLRNLKELCLGNKALEYSMAPQEVISKQQLFNPDLSWFRPKNRLWEEPKRGKKTKKRR